MVRAIWKDTVIADSDDTIVVEGNHYFPEGALRAEHFTSSEHTTVCPWKGTAHYRHVVVGDSVNENAAWCYPAPKDAAKEIAGHIAFWKGVRIDG